MEDSMRTYRRGENSDHCFLLVLSLFLSGFVLATCVIAEESPSPPEPIAPTVKTNPISDPSGPQPLYGPSYPARYAVIQTGAINAMFNSHAQWGSGYDPHYSLIPQFPYTSFELTSGAGVSYLFGGALWVGGVVGSDTLVSVAADGWQNITETYPDGYTSTTYPGSVIPIHPIGDQAFRSECTDTLHAGVNTGHDFIDGRAHKPLPVRIAIRAHSWNTAPANHCILYDVVITNIGTQTIQNGYAGLYFDGDVGDLTDDQRSTDDITGFLPGGGIAYIADNDGDPRQAKPCPGVLCAKLLAESWPGGSLSYNWWIGNASPTNDYGPQQRSTFRNLGTGGLGTPEGDRNKYWYLRNGDIDYDQVMTCAMSNDPNWIPVSQNICQAFSKGFDTRFLLSFGPFALPPDSSSRFIFSTFAIDSLHTNPDNDLNLGLRGGTLNPLAYEANLNLAGVTQMGHVADSLAQFLVDPSTQVYGLRVTRRTADTIFLEWDDWGFGSIDGYNIYASPIPDTAFPVKGILPPWYTPSQQTLVAQIGRQHQFALTSIDSTKPYVINVAHRFGSQVGSLGTPLQVRFDILPATPIMLDSLCFFKQPTGARMRWHQPAGPTVHHYNIYKFDSTWAANKFLPFYTTVRQSFDYNRMFYRNGQTWYYYALPVWATVSGSETTFVDLRAKDGDRYTVTAVDSDGYMSNYSGVSTIMMESTRSKDVLVMVDSDPTGNYVVRDSIRSYYNRLLSGYSHDIYSWYDSSAWPYCEGTTPACMDWHDFMKYRLIIIDDGMYDGILASWYEDQMHGFNVYLASGGQIAYFGSFSRMGGSYLNLTTNPGEYKRTHSIISQYFGIDSVFYVGALYYQRHSVPPYQDSLFGFYKGEAVSPAPGDIFYDATHDRMKASFRSFWPVTTPPSVSTFHLTTAGQPIYTYRSLFPTKSMNEGQVAGVLTAGPITTTYLYGFHLWYMDSTSAQSLVDWMVGQTPPAPSPASETPQKPLEFTTQNYPNPFNPSTTIGFTLIEKEHVSVIIYNMLGQIVRSVCDNDMEPGIHDVVWDGTSNSGHAVSSGVYFYRLIAGPNVAIRKMLLLK
jgi:hypothetical protein